MTITRIKVFSREEMFEGLRRAYYAPFNPRKTWEDYEPKFELLDAWEGKNGGTNHLARLVSTSRYFITHSSLGKEGIVFDSIERIEDALPERAFLKAP